MSFPGFVPGLPGMRSVKTATSRIIFRQGDPVLYALGRIIDGANSRDSGNTGNLNVLRAGLLMGKITATGLYAPSILGVTAGAYTSGGTSITVSAAQAVEIVRRVGATGNLSYVGPPSANGTVAVTATIAYSAVNVTTGVITTATLGVNKVAGTFVVATDGSGTPLTMIDDGYGVIVTDTDNTTSLSVPFAQFPVAGTVLTANLLPVWPSDTSLQAWIETSLNAHGKFVLDYAYN